MNTANLGEVAQYFRHFVSSLATANVDDNVAVRELRQRLRNDGLTTAKCTRHSACTSLYTPRPHT